MSVNVFLFNFPGAPGVCCAFQYGDNCESGLDGNISFRVNDSPARVVANRERLKAQLPGASAWCECHQVHGVQLLIDPEPTAIDPGPLLEADGMMTARAGLALMIKTADCQPVFIADASGAHVLALHVGWRGNRAFFPQKAIAAFCREYGLLPRNLLAARGPSLGPNAAEFINFDSEWGPEFAQWHNPASRCMNLWSLTAWQLQQAGIPQENIYALDICTMLNARAFFSYRRGKNTGRQASFIWIREDIH